MKFKYSYKNVKAAKGDLQSYSNRIFFEWVAFDPLTWIIANFTNLTPNQLSIIGYILGTIGAYFFATGHFILGVLGWELLNLFDTFDGRIARLKKLGGGSLGEYIDAYGGYWILFFLVLGLNIGLYRAYHDINLFILGFILYFLMNIHFTEGVLVGYLLGGKKAYKEAVMGTDGKKTKGLAALYGKVLDISKRFGLREPFNMTDIEHTVLAYIPLFSIFFFPIYFQVYVIIIAILFCYQLLWFMRYRILLKIQN